MASVDGWPLLSPAACSLICWRNSSTAPMSWRLSSSTRRTSSTILGFSCLAVIAFLRLAAWSRMYLMSNIWLYSTTSEAEIGGNGLKTGKAEADKLGYGQTEIGFNVIEAFAVDAFGKIFFG